MKLYPTTHVRPMRRSEEARVAEITRACREAAQWKEEDYTSFLSSVPPVEGAGNSILVAEQEGAVIGFVACRAIAGELEILNLGILPDARRRGAGSALMNAAFAWGRECECGHAFCEVRESNQAARTFYSALHFLVRGRRAQYYRDPIEDALILSRML